jgi:hypothetical protein
MFRTLRLTGLAFCGMLAAYVAFPDRTPVTGLLLDSRDGRLVFADDGDALQPAGEATRLLMAHLLSDVAETPSAADVHWRRTPDRSVAPAAVVGRMDYQPLGSTSEVRGEKAVLAGRLNRQAAAMGLRHTRFTLSGDVLSGVTTAHDLAVATRALEASDQAYFDVLGRQGGGAAAPGVIQRIAGLPCRLPGRGTACRTRPAERPVVAVVMGDGVNSIADVLTLAGLTWQVARNVIGGRDVALVQTLASGPATRTPAPPLRIELV